MATPDTEVTETTTRAGNTVQKTTQVHDGTAETEHATNVVDRVIWLIAGIISAILALRFVLALLGANPDNAFASFIYGLSRPFVAPFFGLFSYDSTYTGVGRFELFTLVAIVVYLLLAWLVSKIINVART